MSASHSIFQKLCPSCATSVPVTAERCACGYAFDGSGTGTSAEETTLRDEELYETYLSARATQAEEAARAAVEALYDDPENPQRVSAADLAKEVFNSLNSDLLEQRKKIAALRKVFSSTSRQPVSKPVAAKSPAGVAAPKPSSPAKPQAPGVRPAAASTGARAPAQNAAAKPITKPAPKAPAPVAAENVLTSTPAGAAARAASVLEAIKIAKSREVAARAHQAMQKQAVAAASAGIPAGFRAEQAARAEKALAADCKECPNCTASVANTTSRCGCGFVFVTHNSDLPSLTLCTGDFTALRNDFLRNQRGRS